MSQVAVLVRSSVRTTPAPTSRKVSQRRALKPLPGEAQSARLCPALEPISNCGARVSAPFHVKHRRDPAGDGIWIRNPAGRARGSSAGRGPVDDLRTGAPAHRGRACSTASALETWLADNGGACRPSFHVKRPSAQQVTLDDGPQASLPLLSSACGAGAHDGDDLHSWQLERPAVW
jgi:hypothetical protein